MISLFRKLMRNKRGNALAIAAACLPLFVGAAGLATDTIQWTLWKRQLQRAADSAAIAGVYDRESASGATTNTDPTVTHDLAVNLHTFYALQTGRPNCGGKCTISYPADTAFQENQVSVTIAIQQPLTFSSLFMSTAPTIIATSRAAAVPAGGSACFQATSTNASETGIMISGNAGISAPDCIMYSNPPSTNSAYAKGSADVTVQAVAAVGGIQESNNWHVEAYRPYSPKIPDPFASVNPSPSDMSCVGSTLDEGTNVTALIASGTNCWTGLRIGASASVTLPPGKTYYINGGDAFIQGDLTCVGCTIVLTNIDTSPTATIGQFKVNSGSKINLSAPTGANDKFRGIAVYQDRRAPDVSGKPNLINGNSSSVITGALYFPNQQLNYNGTGNTSAVCTMFVAYRLNFTGNSTTTNKFKSLADCADEGLPANNAVRMVRLVG
jgi:Flp pilus assembly protein TadG